ncbi:hypothetical protein E9976_25615, partial [Salmonella enterica subsp. enterica serovar Hvittingfoss]|nr:hypothetical protein [Salmonella enterica subsp. enterica serovar Hvittingfoss]
MAGSVKAHVVQRQRRPVHGGGVHAGERVAHRQVAAQGHAGTIVPGAAAENGGGQGDVARGGYPAAVHGRAVKLYRRGHRRGRAGLHRGNRRAVLQGEARAVGRVAAQVRRRCLIERHATRHRHAT